MRSAGGGVNVYRYFSSSRGFGGFLVGFGGRRGGWIGGGGFAMLLFYYYL